MKKFIHFMYSHETDNSFNVEVTFLILLTYYFIIKDVFFNSNIGINHPSKFTALY